MIGIGAKEFFKEDKPKKRESPPRQINAGGLKTPMFILPSYTQINYRTSVKSPFKITLSPLVNSISVNQANTAGFIGLPRK